jgi:hypothetical protein
MCWEALGGKYYFVLLKPAFWLDFAVYLSFLLGLGASADLSPDGHRAQGPSMIA